jgi:uncharacterized repeat protein (TIGR02543 family)
MENFFTRTDEMRPQVLQHKWRSWFINSTWLMLLLMSVLMWQCEKDTFEGETVGLCPEVISTDPASGATNVVTNKKITATFNVAMVPASVNAQTYTIKQGTTMIPGVVTYADKIATFTPAKPLEDNKIYTGMVSKKVKDPDGNFPINDYIWSFTTGDVPRVIATDPLSAASSVPLNKIITATFSTTMDPATINTATFLVNQGIDPIAGAVSYTGTIATFTPTSPLIDNKVYTGTITIGAKDVLGNAMASHYKWSFSTSQTQFTIALSSNPSEGGSANGGGLYNKDDEATVIAVPVAGHTFTNWTEGANIVSTNSSYTFTVTSNRALVANFTINTFTLNITAVNGAVTKVPNQTTFNYGTSVLLTAVPNTGYSFTGWSGDVTGASNTVTVIMNSNKNITATFALIPPNNYTLDVTATLGGTATKNPIQAGYPQGTVVQVTATPNTGYTFAGWSGDASGNTNPLPVTMNSNKNITAIFTLIPVNTYTITATAVNGIIARNPNQVSYNQGATVQLTATPDLGYSFTGWSGDVTGNVNPVTITMNSNKNITANFTLIPPSTYTLDVTAINGSVNKVPNNPTYNSGATVQLTATPNIGYTFTSWSGHATGSINPVTVLMNQNKTVTANFTALPSGPAGINLRSAGDFAILAGSGISNTGVTTMINGDVGSFPTATINGLLDGNVNGTLYTVADPIVGQAKEDLTTAFNDAQSRSLDAISLPGQIGGLTLTPGLYVNSTTSGISGTGPLAILTLDAGGNPNAVWIFKMGSTFITDASTAVVLAGGAKAENIYWSVGTSATLGTNSVFYGNILADQAITLTTGATLNGRALTRVAAVVLDSNTVSKP